MIMKQTVKFLYAALLAGFIGIIIICLTMFLTVSYASEPEEDMMHSALYYELESEADSLISGLKLIPDTTDVSSMSDTQQRCLSVYQDYSALFDRADDAYDTGSIDNTEYAALIELLNDLGDDLNSEFERLGFDPYATDLAYSKTVSSGSISKYVSNYQWSASYNGSNIIVNFSFSIKVTNYRLHTITVGASGALLSVNAYGYNHATSDPTVGAKYFKSNFGTVTLTSISMGTSSTTASGYITITNASGFQSWYNAGTRPLVFTTYSDSGTDYEFYPDSSTGMNPTSISNVATALTQAVCSHSYSCTAVDASTHKTACTKCGYSKGTAAHNSSVTDTSSSPGYTLKKCSSCSYVVSSTSNSYSVQIDMGTGDETDNITVTAIYNTSMPDITLPSRLGYTFSGCYSEPDGGGVQYYLSDGKSAHLYDLSTDATLYAYWERSCALTSFPVIRNEFACIEG